jgi:hypothetical protein
VLGLIQEVRAALHTRKQRSAKAATAFDVTSHLTELETLRGRQAVTATIKVVQLLIFVRCQKVQEASGKEARGEFRDDGKSPNAKKI